MTAMGAAHRSTRDYKEQTTDPAFLKVGGYDDHIHILCMLSKKITLIKLMEEVKSHSSKWIKTLDRSLENFYWQDGYALSLLVHQKTESVIKYISNQRVHHNTTISRMSSEYY